MNKKILAVLSLTGIAAALGLTVIPNVNNGINHKTHLSMQKEAKATTEYMRQIPDTWVEGETYEYGGLSYTLNSSRILTANIVKTPSEVTELILYSRFGSGGVIYGEIDFAQYTNVTSVIIVANNTQIFNNILPKLPKLTDIYVSGGLQFNTVLENVTATNLYLCDTYLNKTSTVTDQTFKTNLAKSSIKNIYYNKLHKEANMTKINSLIAANISNKNQEKINITEMNLIAYPNEVFHPFPYFDDRSSIFGAKTYYETTNSDIVTSSRDFEERMISVDSKVQNISLKNPTTGFGIVKTHKYKKIIASSLKGFNFTDVDSEELICRPLANTYIALDKCNKLKSIRFLATPTNVEFGSEVVHPNIEKIYIPQSQSELFKTFMEREDVKNKVELYDVTKYEVPYASYLDNDQKEIFINDGTYTLEEAEFMKNTLDTLKIDHTNKAVDRLNRLYEFPDKPTYKENKYSMREVTRIVLPKNMDAVKVIKEYSEVLILNNGRMCDPSSFKIKSIDTKEYTVGTNGAIDVTFVYPDAREELVNIKIINSEQEGQVAYLLDSKNNINLLTPITKNKTNLTTLLKPLMDNHFKESNVEYNESEILDTTYPTFNCGNEYKGSTHRGKVRVLVANPEHTSPDTSTDTDDIETEGFNMLEVDKIYTTTSIDGSKLLAGLRNDICTYKGSPYEINFAIAYNDHDNTKDWTFEAFTRINDNDSYSRHLNVKIIEHSLKMGFVVFKDGTIALEFNWSEYYNKEQILAGLTEFLTSQGLSTENIKIPERFVDTGVYHATYGADNKKLLIINSGYNISYTNENKPFDDTQVKKGYKAMSNIYYTKEYTMEQALRLMCRNFLLKDGILQDNYKIDFRTSPESTNVHYSISVDGKEVLNNYVNMIQVESKYSYVFGRMNDFDYGYMAVNMIKEAPTYTVTEVLTDVVERFRSFLDPINPTPQIDFTKTGHVDIDGVYQVGNGTHYKYEYNVNVVELEYELKNNECTINGKANAGISLGDKFNKFFETIKEKFEQNNAFKAVTIIIGSVTGLLLIYGFYKLIKWILKWFRK